MFTDSFSFKALAITVISYLLATNIVFAVVFAFSMPAGVSDPEAIAQWAETDGGLLFWQNVIGLVAGIACGALATKLSGSAGLRNAATFGGLLVLYGVLGIYMHPDHPLWMQALKLLAPIPTVLAGGWLAAKNSPERNGA